jgi:hypothetical protein
MEELTYAYLAYHTNKTKRKMQDETAAAPSTSKDEAVEPESDWDEKAAATEYGKFMTDDTAYENNKTIMNLYTEHYQERINQLLSLLNHYEQQSIAAAQLRKLIYNEHMHLTTSSMTH